MKKSIYAVIAAALLLANSFAVAQTATVPSVNSLSNRAATYRAVITGIATASTPTDIFRISGSATKTVYIKRISVDGVKTTSGTLLVNLIKRSTANSDGTTVAITEHANFGSPPYSISSGNADANGHGNFEYAVPSGYFALCTKNLAEFG
jgi:Tfp pilus assembly protein FimT